jgi:hypothetical protein
LKEKRGVLIEAVGCAGKCEGGGRVGEAV